MEKSSFFPIPQRTIWGIAFFIIIFFSFSMKNKFINNNGVNLHNTSKKQIKKTKVEIQIEKLKQQKQAINKEL